MSSWWSPAFPGCQNTFRQADKKKRVVSPDKRPFYPCSTCSRRKAYTQWSAHQCCWKGNHHILKSKCSVLCWGSNDWLTGSWFSQQNWLSRLRSSRAWPHNSPGRCQYIVDANLPNNQFYNLQNRTITVEVIQSVHLYRCITQLKACVNCLQYLCEEALEKLGRKAISNAKLRQRCTRGFKSRPCCALPSAAWTQTQTFLAPEGW